MKVSMPTTSKKSVVIIGAGPGGEAAAKRAAQHGFRVTLVEKRDLGGLCLNRGCIPSKTLLEAGRLLHQVRTAAEYVTGQDHLAVNWLSLQRKKTSVVASLRHALTRHLAGLGVQILNGEASFLNAKTLSVRTDQGVEKLPFDKAVLATGSRTVLPPALTPFKDKLLDSDKALDLDRLPARLLIVGGGAVGCEMACLFNELGSLVTIVEKTSGLLPGEDPAVVRALQSSFQKQGITVQTDSTLEGLEGGPGRWMARLSNGQNIDCDEVLVCIGRRPAVDGLGLEQAGVRATDKQVPVNEYLQTSQPHIYATGDINGLSLLAHAAARQGEVAADHMAGILRPYANHLVPRCLYSWPEVASVGEWVHSAEGKGAVVKSQRFFFKGSPKAMANNETDGFIQVVSEKNGQGRLLGAQIIGPHATELIHIFAVALQAEFSLDQLRDVIYAHPTLSEGVKEAVSR
jgi:dihydrolipoamide dehydrogenase